MCHPLVLPETQVICDLNWVSLYIFKQKIIGHRFVKLHKKHKSTKNVLNSIFKKCQSSDRYGSDFGWRHNRVTGLWAAKWLSKTKRVQTSFLHSGMYLWNSKGNFCPYSSKQEFNRKSKQSCHCQLKQHRSRKWIVSYRIGFCAILRRSVNG